MDASRLGRYGANSEAMPSVCLNMIVHDDAGIIEPCLASARPFISAWAIVDTGSTDGTQDIVRRCLAGVPGELIERPWKSLAHNRNEALALAAPRAEFVLLLEPGEVLVAEPGFRLVTLAADALRLRVKRGELSCREPRIVRASLPWSYAGVASALLACPSPHTAGNLSGLTVHATQRNAIDAARLRQDAAMLEEALRAEPDDARSVFDLAQRYQDLGDTERAIAMYERRAGMGGPTEEAWYALYQAAVLKERAGRDRGAVVEAYLRAYGSRPRRAEPLCELARYHRERGEWEIAHLFAKSAVAIARPDDPLFVQDSTYDWRSLDEYAVSAFHVGKIDESLESTKRLLSCGTLPLEERARVEANKTLCLARADNAARAERNRRKRQRKGR